MVVCLTALKRCVRISRVVCLQEGVSELTLSLTLLKQYFICLFIFSYKIYFFI